jgi:DNA-binding NarL/FixJ family response regulator
MEYNLDIRPSELLRVLVIDSRLFVNESLVALLSESEELTVFGCAQDPAKALALVETVHPDVVVLDLPEEMSTWMKMLKQIKRLPGRPVVIALSHYDLPPFRHAAMNAGADLFLTKTKDCGYLQELLHGLAPRNSVHRRSMSRLVRLCSLRRHLTDRYEAMRDDGLVRMRAGEDVKGVLRKDRRLRRGGRAGEKLPP